MSLKEIVSSKFSQLLSESDKTEAINISIEILELLDEDKFPVYKSLDEVETSYSEIFINYFQSFDADRNFNDSALHHMINSLNQRL